MAQTRPLQSLDMMVNMGPQHPSTHGVFRMVLWVDGEYVVDSEPYIGYLHRGTEKLAEGELYPQIITLFDRLDYLGNFNNEWALCLAMEKLMGVQVPERAEYIRLILCELNRISSHMLFYGTMGLDAGAMTPVMWGFREREKIQRLFEMTSGARMMHNYFRIGGLKEDVPDDFKKRIIGVVSDVERALEECDKLLTYNEVFLLRTVNVGKISGKEALDWGVTGPCLRASGVPYDVRLSEPYSFYDRFQFDVPVGKNGDTWDRYAMRVEEMRQSIKIVKQALQQMPDTGPFRAAGQRLIPRPPKGEVYMGAENPRGEFGVYIVSDGTDKPYRLKIRPPSFVNLEALKTMLRGCYVADAVVILGSLDIVLGEVDR